MNVKGTPIYSVKPEPQPLFGHEYEEAIRKIVREEIERHISGLSEQPPAHASDCALHNAPAYPPGPCDCGANASR